MNEGRVDAISTPTVMHRVRRLMSRDERCKQVPRHITAFWRAFGAAEAVADAERSPDARRSVSAHRPTFGRTGTSV